jgi:hypothetical protein
MVALHLYTTDNTRNVAESASVELLGAAGAGMRLTIVDTVLFLIEPSTMTNDSRHIKHSPRPKTRCKRVVNRQ